MAIVNARSFLKLILLPVVLSCPAPGLESKLNITVHTFDYSGASPAAMEQAQSAAEMPFLQAGIQIRWLNCPVPGLHSVAVPGCESRTDATHFVLVVLPEHMARKMAHGPRQFGLAVLNNEGGFPNQAYVFIQRAVHLGKVEMVPWTIILGHLIAHEIGHLLLVTNSHFPQGIMRADWRRTEVKQALMGRLTFTAQQLDRIRDDMQRRLKTRPQPLNHSPVTPHEQHASRCPPESSECPDPKFRAAPSQP